jgi:hypothetical protein
VAREEKDAFCMSINNTAKGRVKERPGDCSWDGNLRIKMAFEVCDAAECEAEVDREG